MTTFPTNAEICQEAEYRYHHDAEFHALVYAAASVALEAVHADHERPTTELAWCSAAVALVVLEHHQKGTQ